ncbi:putative nuclear pore protein [Neofusicoccum parvum UCRNP2]|uniref:Putative nuclear pore protein n=1 Tax=Botryosphaeria parva (strain UCR-NP2) TaxID=1287680 RepID=R1GN17_BOTPV|nr:putative nuclear pore protein [Neofusicoccum parvum UCRNP2]
MDNVDAPARAPRRDSIQAQLDLVTTKLTRPHFLHTLTPSRLPSQATSDASLSPKDRDRDGPAPAHRRAHSAARSEPSDNSFLADALRQSTSLLTLEHGSRPVTDAPFEAYPELRASEAKARSAWRTMAASQPFSSFDHGHQDLVLAVDFNFFGTRMVTASSDHRLKVWDRKDDAWSLVDSWRAHDAEVVDVKWNGPFMGEVVGSIGEDGRFKIWQEDVTEIANSGRRFKLISSQVSETRTPFMSLDFKQIMQETWVALITRDGMLTVNEPVDHGNLSEWQILAQTQVLQPPPPRSEETSFRVCFHKEQLPCWSAVNAGLDRRALSLAVVAMDVVKVYRSDKNRRFYVAAELTGSRNILRDLAWANGSMRGTDIIATASKDGLIRVYELSTPEHSQHSSLAPPTAPEPQPSPRSRRNAPSGIGAGLAGASRVGESHENDQDPGRVKHVVKMVGELASGHGAVWRVSFSQMGDLLVSTGDDGAIRTWKKASNNRWLEYAEIDPGKGQ